MAQAAPGLTPIKWRAGDACHAGAFDAALLAEYDVHRPHWPRHIQQMICEDIRAVPHGGDLGHARALHAVLHHFISGHPEALRGAELRCPGPLGP